MSEETFPLLTNWNYIGGVIWAEIYNDARFIDGTVVQTSAVIDIDEDKNYAKTRNTTYCLGVKANEC